MPQIHQPSVLTWRQYLNPLRALTLSRIITWLELSERGIFPSLQWFYRFMEKREPTLRAIKKRRLAAIDNLTWSIAIREDVLDEAKELFRRKKAAKERQKEAEKKQKQAERLAALNGQEPPKPEDGEPPPGEDEPAPFEEEPEPIAAERSVKPLPFNAEPEEEEVEEPEVPGETPDAMAEDATGGEAEDKWLDGTNDGEGAEAEAGEAEAEEEAEAGSDFDEEGEGMVLTPRLQMAKAQQQALKEAYEGVTNLREAIRHLALAEFRGFAHLEKHYSNDGDVVRLQPVPQWNWSRKVDTKEWLYNEKAIDGNMGLPLDPMDWVIRTVDDPIDETLSYIFFRKNLGVKDWDGFQETYGIPSIFIELPEGATPADRDAFQETCERIVSDMRGVLPAGCKVNSVDVAIRGKNPFGEHITYQDEQIVLTGTGGKLTMMNDPVGIGGGQAEVHRGTFDAIAAADGKEISEVLQEQFDAAFLDVNFPGQDHLAFFRLAPVEVVDADKVVQHSVMLKNAGWKIARHQLEEKTGYELDEPPTPPPQPPPFGGGRPGGGAPFGARFPEGAGNGNGNGKPPNGDPGGRGNGAPPKPPWAFRNDRRGRLGGSPLPGRRERVVANQRSGAGDVADQASRAVAEAAARDLAEVRKRLRRALEIEDAARRSDELLALKAALPGLLKRMNANPATEQAFYKAMSGAFAVGFAEVATDA